MSFFRDSFVSSATAPGVALPPASMQSSVLESSCITVYTAVLGSSFLLRSTFCIHAVVGAVLPRSNEKNSIFGGTLKDGINRNLIKTM